MPNARSAWYGHAPRRWDCGPIVSGSWDFQPVGIWRRQRARTSIPAIRGHPIRLNARGRVPDFLILGYPVISMNSEYTHAGSRTALLGDHPDPKLLEDLSNDQRVTAQTPPTFLFQTNADTTVPAENSVRFYLALRKAGVPAELHIYEQGPHGVGLASTNATLSSWPGRLADWLRGRGLL